MLTSLFHIAIYVCWDPVNRNTAIWKCVNKKRVLCLEFYVCVLSAGVNSLFCPNSSSSQTHTLPLFLLLSLCLLFSEVYWLFRSEAKMRRFRQQPQKQPAIRGIFISIHGVSVSACLKEREKGVSTPLLPQSCSAAALPYTLLRVENRAQDRTVLMWFVCVCVLGVIAEDWGVGLYEEDAMRRLKPPLKQHCTLTQKQSTSL